MKSTSAQGSPPASVKAIRAKKTTAVAMSGAAKTRRADDQVTRRQASRGPMPVKRTIAIATGVVYWSNHGAASVARSPVNASAISGKKVPRKMMKTSSTSSRLLTRKIASREAMESMRRSARRSERRLMISAVEPRITTAIRARIGPPTVESPKAWIDCRIPERTRNVPSRASENVATIRETFQARSIPRFSWTITECRKAVPISHGIIAAFSTGSQAQ